MTRSWPSLRRMYESQTLKRTSGCTLAVRLAGVPGSAREVLIWGQEQAAAHGG